MLTYLKAESWWISLLLAFACFTFMVIAEASGSRKKDVVVIVDGFEVSRASGGSTIVVKCEGAD